jgi:transcriptional regulator with XRE-family HTH domain
MLIGMQVRIARTALGWSVAKLASESLVSARTINRLETEKEEFTITPANLKMICQTLEAAGIEFIGTPDDGPGVRLWRK